MKIVFMGTPEFAVPGLEALIENFTVEAVLTQPDKARGRGKKITFSPIKEVAVKHNIEVLQPNSLRKEREVIDRIKEIEPDFIIVVAYGQILTKEVLDIPKYACINLHASLLPKFRGAAPINWAIINGEKKSGNTTMHMDVGLDTGDMLLKQEVEIKEDMTYGELHDILMENGAQLLVDTINGIVDETIKPEKQNHEESCYASKLDKKMACIDWNKSSKEIHDFVRGLNPWPVAYTYYGDKVMKIYETKSLDKDVTEEPGTITKVNAEGIEIACGTGALLINKIQFPGKKALEVKEYLKGNSIEEKTLLGICK